jgi:mono/diheme cytochrome c family protein
MYWIRRGRLLTFTLFFTVVAAWLILSAQVNGPAGAADNPSHATFDQAVRPFLTTHCVSCHGEEKPKGGLRLDTLRPDFADKETAEAWAKVLLRVSAGEMPPKKQPRPAKAETDAVTAWVAAEQRAVAERHKANGRVALRRLNRVEYENTLRDLLALPNLEVKDVLPPDDAAHGFDNVSAAQSLSYVQMGRYLDAADLALDEAGCFRAKSERQVIRIDFQKMFSNRGAWPSDNWIVFLCQPNSAQAPWKIPGVKKLLTAGYYTVRVRCRGAVYQNAKLLPQDRNHVASIYTREKRLLTTFDVPAEPGIVEFTAWLHAGDALEFFCASMDDRSPPGRKVGFHTGPGVAVEYMEIDGPSNERWPWESHRRLYGDLPVTRWTAETGLTEPGQLPIPVSRDPKKPSKTAGKFALKESGNSMIVASRQPLVDAERLLRDFMARAYRRPVEEAEFRRCFAFARQGIEKKLCLQDALRPAYKAVLCSPDFLFLNEAPGRLDGYALAARLSYFLWRSMPDETLLTLAKSGTLRDPDILRAQVDRMLADSKVNRFVNDFTDQWLDLRKINDTAPDRFLYPEYFCDNHLVESAVLETRTYFAEMLRKDLSATAVVSSDFAMLNERLAKLYGISGVKGSAIRRVPLPAGSVRGGILTQASVLKVTANGLTTSPVLRGAWVLDRLLGQPAPPPPPDAGAIEPDTRGTTTIREQLVQHRKVESCASCHAKIDPPGFALESFDVMGAWRTRYRSLEKGDEPKRTPGTRVPKYKLGPGVDASGETPDGQAFRDIAGFRKLMLDRPEPLARNLVARMLTFATGAGVGPSDRPAVDDILRKTKDAGHGLRSIVHEVVQSELFQTK